MNAWTTSELDKIARAEELEVATRRRDGTLRDPVTVWMVRLGDDLYVRSVKGRTGAWFRGALAHHEGRVRAGGVQRDATLRLVPREDARATPRARPRAKTP